MGEHIATTLVKLLIASDIRVSDARVGILGLAFKENVRDLRNSRVPDIIRTLRDYRVEALVHDPLISPEEALVELGITLRPLDQLTDLDGLILAVPHQRYLDAPVEQLTGLVRDGGVLIDVKSVLPPASSALPHHRLEPLIAHPAENRRSKAVHQRAAEGLGLVAAALHEPGRRDGHVAGSLRLPRTPRGFRYGESVSTRRRSDGTRRATSALASSPPRKTSPLKLTARPSARAASA